MDLFPDGRAVFVFILATVVMGGGAAWMTGRAFALAWRPWWRVVLPMLLLGLAVRFVHYAVFRGTLLSLPQYAIDAATCLAFGLASFRVTRVGQMVTRYHWINERAGQFDWRRRAQIANDTK
jgi:hypothetical protein